MTNDIIIAQATAPGHSGIAVVRLSGKGCISMVHKQFSNPDISTANGKTIHFGIIRDLEKEPIDECLISLFREPSSYTKEDTIEISCHGSQYIVDRIISVFIKKGARLAERGEFTKRAFLNGQLDLSQAEAVLDLIKSDTEYTHEHALSQLRGGYSSLLKSLRAELIDFASLIELELDFSEEDVEFVSRKKLIETIEKIAIEIKKLCSSYEQGNTIKKGIKTAIVGKPNVGKSTLLNALVNDNRAIVSHIAGTTRDTIEETLIIGGIKFMLIDTAGIRDSKDTIERIGIERALSSIEDAQMVLYVLDITEGDNVNHIKEVRKTILSHQNFIVVINKVDLVSNASLQGSYDSVGKLFSDPIVSISAKNKSSIERLTDKMLEIVNFKKIEDRTIITNARHYEALIKTDEALTNVVKNIKDGISSDFIAMDLRQALHHLGQITGEIYTDDILSNIFSNFCIGK